MVNCFSNYKYIIQGTQVLSLFESRIGRLLDMKLVLLLSLAALVACDYSASKPEAPSNAYAVPEKIETIGDHSASIEPGKSIFNFKNFYQGAFPPAHFPSTNFFSSPSFPSFGYPLKTFNYAATPQGILPPISQIIPPQFSQIVPPISQIIPPIFGNANPTLPSPSPVTPSQLFPPVSQPLAGKFSFPYYSPLYQFPYTYPASFSFPSTTFFSTSTQKQPAKPQPECLPTSYGTPASAPADPEPSGPAESSAPFEPSPVSYPYEPAVPEAPESGAPHKPAQEYGFPSSKL